MPCRYAFPDSGRLGAAQQVCFTNTPMLGSGDKAGSLRRRATAVLLSSSSVSGAYTARICCSNCMYRRNTGIHSELRKQQQYVLSPTLPDTILSLVHPRARARVEPVYDSVHGSAHGGSVRHPGMRPHNTARARRAPAAAAARARRCELDGHRRGRSRPSRIKTPVLR